MRQRWLLNLALLLVILVLAALVFSTIEKEENKPESPKLTDIKKEQVQNIRLERADKEAIFLMKDALGFWQMTAPFNLPAKHFYIDRLLQFLSVRDYKQLEGELNLADFKLEPPLASIKFDQLTVAFGNNSPIGYGQRYVQIKEKVYLLTDNLYNIVSGDALAFASLSLLGNNPKITELKMPDYHLILKEGKWTLNSTFSSDEVDTSADAISALIDNWQKASAVSVAPYHADSSAQGEIDITLLDQVLHFSIVSTTPDLVLAQAEKGVQYKFYVNQVDQLLHLPTKSNGKNNDK
ncbi:hypothetical protein PN36_09675 [Candidatus Thiomargarita nelsonii]|uniref:DUF4340 domain-containing protein n=1 Tax=Candidatus Thiomargarita nelsonii TaxID=1003181 RepID=A0A0A6RTL3_9GAMM|nr:hypothetical protein PN36_09675 [Candidatus Thiomargarita nelsonii]